MLRQRSSTPWWRSPLQRTNAFAIVGSILFCAILQPHRIPGMVLLDTSPNWFLIWVVAWSAKRLPWQGLTAGIALGFIQDALTAAQPTHALSLGIAGFLTSSLDKQRLIAEDFISTLLLVFIMALLVETIFAGQLAIGGDWELADIWVNLQRAALSSAIISSLWTPLLYVPLNYWWDRFNARMDP
ncbi:rod shape-determining protein MreD [Altericista sp. CCNU0014]|uniref:rod shape-determining protein MreD n=1 Tax=Altericista sp. CCNU0014 TaxID=3082949 RepID=UPI00384A6892